MNAVPNLELADVLAAHWTHDEGGGDYLACGCGHYFSSPQTWSEHLKSAVDKHVDGQAEKLADAVQGMWRLITKLDETSDGLGDWHDATEYIDWARKEVQEIYVRAALEGE